MHLNAVMLFDSLDIDAAVKQLAADGFPVTDELLARLSPLQYDHITPRPLCLHRARGTWPA
ncbi:Tn3 family transposase [Streptomyces lavendulocolor]